MRPLSSTSPFYRPARTLEQDRQKAERQPGGVRAYLQQMDGMRRWLLLGLGSLALIITIATVLYALAPTGGNVAMSGHPGQEQNSAPAPFTGTFTVTSDGDHGPVQLTLKQFGTDVTGTETTTVCMNGVPQMSTIIITGQLLDTNAIKLTATVPDHAHSLTTVYTVATSLNTTGMILSWRDDSGQAQFQRWTPAAANQYTIAAGAFCHQ